MQLEQLLYFSTSVARILVNNIRTRPKRIRRIMVVKLDEIGDMVYALPTIGKLKENYPDAEITVWCLPVNASWIGAQKGCDRIITVLKEDRNSYDLWIDLRGNWKSLSTAVFRQKSWYLDRGTIRLKQKFEGAQRHEWETNLRVISEADEVLDASNPRISINIEVDEKKAVEKLLNELGVEEYIVLHTGARDEARRWPADRFASLIDALSTHFKGHFLLVGSQEEYDLNQAVVIACSTKKVVNVAGKTSLKELSSLIANAKIFIGNESGPLHFAIAHQKPLVALFGPGVKDVFYPLYDNQIVLHHFKERNHTQQNVDNSTILLITVEDVLKRVRNLI